ncbi:hypothetical protein M9H77_28293 [Catharanthus roseus]|uniref:Uncharacterized protein n=1 Tax=Catharanthus roseus TaxID=4058 RepID=A0ACC0AF47_CATRO|nr:hypothetical protein M9H77_28293 [Catharanthus roseus]
MKQKINNLNISEELKDSLEKLFLESDESEEINSASELDHIYDSSESSEEEMWPCKQGFSESDKEENDYYKLISQFQDSDINVLTNNHILEFLKSIKDPELRSRMIENMDDIPSTSTSPPKKEVEFIPNNNPYSMTEVYKLMKQRYEDSHKSPTTLKDLYGEINHLKDEIKILKQMNQTLDTRVSNLEIKKDNPLVTPNLFDNLHKIGDENFLTTLDMITSFKFYVKITLLISKDEIKEFTALIDTGAILVLQKFCNTTWQQDSCWHKFDSNSCK